jgi:hypothetical protein
VENQPTKARCYRVGGGKKWLGARLKSGFTGGEQLSKEAIECKRLTSPHSSAFPLSLAEPNYGGGGRLQHSEN